MLKDSKAVDAMLKRSVCFEQYSGTGADEKEIVRGDSPDIAWFTDPAGNVLSVIRDN